MAQRSMFFDAVSGDRSYDAASLAALLRALVQRDGVVYGYGGGLAVSATDPASMNVVVATGAAFVQGRMFEIHTSGEQLAIGAADPTNPRRDRVVVKLDNSSAVRKVSVVVKAGTPAASPTPPTLQRDGTVWELSLAQVYVAAGATSISSANITDERANATLCGNAFEFLSPTTGHKHTGAAGDGPTLPQTSIVNVPAVRTYHSVNQSIADSTFTPLAFDSERFDTDNMHSTTTNNTRLTANTPGKYLITGTARFDANSTGQRRLGLRVNGATYIAFVLHQATTTTIDLTVTTVYSLAAGDYVELLAWQTSGAALNVLANPALSPEFAMVRVGD